MEYQYMRIKYYLATLIFACLASAYAVEYHLSTRHQGIQVQSQQHLEYHLALNDLLRVKKDLAQYMLTTDLVLGNDQTYLLDSAFRNSALIRQSLADLESTNLYRQHQVEFDRLVELIQSTHQLLVHAQNISDENRVANLSKLMTSSDSLGSALITALAGLIEATTSEDRIHEAALAGQIDATQKMTVWLRMAYLVVVIFLWIWASIKICTPIRNISTAAMSIGSSDTVNLVTSGPTEILELSNRLQEVASDLVYQARHDPLTGLINRREFARQLEEEHRTEEHCKRKKLLCFIDLDRFKLVNDSCGHAAGDELLILVAKTIKAYAGEKSIVARLGGDEFAVLLDKLESEEGLVVANDILGAIRAIKFDWKNSIYRISASIGVTCVADMQANISEWLNAADSACFVAKEMGRDKIQQFDVNDQRLYQSRHDTKLYNDIIQALEQDSFVLYCQDIVPLLDSPVDYLHYEILIRMLTTQGDVVPPGEFLGAVEQFHLAERLDQWVVEHTLDWLLDNPRHLDRLHRCSINLSGQSIASGSMCDFIVEKIQSTKFPAHKICFEVTETAAIQDMEEASLFIKKVGALGCLFALDDFGSGLSSFAYLQQLNVDVVKIDGEFVKNIETNDLNETMVKCINEITQAAGMVTVAEYVENREIAQRLTKMGVNYAQGYHFDKPSPLADRVTLKSQLIR